MSNVIFVWNGKRKRWNIIWIGIQKVWSLFTSNCVIIDASTFARVIGDTRHLLTCKGICLSFVSDSLIFLFDFGLVRYLVSRLMAVLSAVGGIKEATSAMTEGTNLNHLSCLLGVPLSLCFSLAYKCMHALKMIIHIFPLWLQGCRQKSAQLCNDFSTKYVDPDDKI